VSLARQNVKPNAVPTFAGLRVAEFVAISS
jgi:hypothetical protein